MRVQLRIVAGSLRGRKINCQVSPELRPTPQMVREALFSILGNAVPDRPFFDVFAGTGADGLEALSRGASFTSFVERDFRLAQDIDDHLKAFDVAGQAQVIRTDVYRWAGQWRPPAEPVNVFISPPFADFQRAPRRDVDAGRRPAAQGGGRFGAGGAIGEATGPGQSAGVGGLGAAPLRPQ